jgi:hypothetical protein
LAVRVTADPAQIIPSLEAVPDVSVKLMLGLGRGLTVTTEETEAEQIVVELVTVTV